MCKFEELYSFKNFKLDCISVARNHIFLLKNYKKIEVNFSSCVTKCGVQYPSQSS